MRKHYDIYAILKTPQEVHFGEEKQININVVETVKVANEGNGDFDIKLYFSPTKRRGIERRSILWMPIGDKLYTDITGCSIPNTCCSCILCDVFGGLDNEVKKISITSRVTQGGGVAVQPLPPEVKQRLRVDSDLKKKIEKEIEEGGRREGKTQPFKKEYIPPNIWFPIYNHAFSVTEEEFGLIAYAFLDAAGRYGAGHGKGGWFVNGEINGEKQPLLVVDEYIAPAGEKPVIDPSINNTKKALGEFAKAITIEKDNWGTDGIIQTKDGTFKRYYGKRALRFLQEQAQNFSKVDSLLQPFLETQVREGYTILKESLESKKKKLTKEVGEEKDEQKKKEIKGQIRKIRDIASTIDRELEHLGEKTIFDLRDCVIEKYQEIRDIFGKKDTDKLWRNIKIGIFNF